MFLEKLAKNDCKAEAELDECIQARKQNAPTWKADVVTNLPPTIADPKR